MSLLSEYYYFSISNNDKSIDDLYVGQHLSSNGNVIIVDGVLLDKSKFPVRSALNFKDVMKEFQSNHHSIQIDTTGLYYQKNPVI